MASDERFGPYPTTEPPKLCSDLIKYKAEIEAAVNDPDFEWDDNAISTDDLEDDDEDNKEEVEPEA